MDPRTKAKLERLKKSGSIAKQTPKDQINRKESGRYLSDELPDNHIGKLIIAVASTGTTRTVYISESQLNMLSEEFEHDGRSVVSWNDIYRLTPKTTDKYIRESIPSMLKNYNMRLTVGSIIKVLRKWHKPRVAHWNAAGQGEVFGHSVQDSDKNVDFNEI